MSWNPGISRRVLRKLDVQDVLCPICRQIYIEPVSLPCKHDVCLNCLQKTVENNRLVCPICRKRIGTFLRLAKNLSKIVNQPFWEQVKSQFPNEIKKKQNGKDHLLNQKLNLDEASLFMPKGSIKFEELINKLAIQEEKTRAAQIINPGQKLAKKFQEEEVENERKQLIEKEFEEADMMYIKNHLFDQKRQTLISPSTSPSSENSVENGRDSITSEFTHFTPICAMPRTPPKVMPNGEEQVVPIYQPKNCVSDRKEGQIQTVKNKTTLKISSNNFSRTKTCPNELESKLESFSDNSSTPYDFLKTQEKIQERIRQEQEDLSLALKLHVKWNKDKTPTKRKHGYKLRSNKKKK